MIIDEITDFSDQRREKSRLSEKDGQGGAAAGMDGAAEDEEDEEDVGEEEMDDSALDEFDDDADGDAFPLPLEDDGAAAACWG